MGKTLYFDCFSGASGDMVLGALLDLGLPLDALRSALGSLAIDYGDIAAERVLRAGVSATKFRLLEKSRHEAPGGRSAAGQQADAECSGEQGDRHHHHHHHHEPHGHHDHGRRDHDDHGSHHRHDHGEAHGHGHDSHGGHAGHIHASGHGHHSLEEIGRHIDRSSLSLQGKVRAKDLFRRLAEAEAAIHDMPVERIHLHEVGAIDSIIDIVGAVFGMEWLGASRIVSSPINVGGGTVRCAHGEFPVPAPATARLLQGVPIYAGPVAKELTTPTGALLVTGYAGSFGPMPTMTLSAVGYGAGDRDFRDHPNVLRLLVGEDDRTGTSERIVTIACEIDDMNPQLFGPLMDRLYAAGALDVYYAPVQMKKNRPGTLVTVLAPPDRREELSALLFRETTTIGVRYLEMTRERLDREVIVIDTALGAVQFKIARRHGVVVNAVPEFEDCARLAAERGLPIKDVQALAMKAWLEQRPH